jgi:hypothetical protein
MPAINLCQFPCKFNHLRKSAGAMSDTIRRFAALMSGLRQNAPGTTIRRIGNHRIRRGGAGRRAGSWGFGTVIAGVTRPPTNNGESS